MDINKINGNEIIDFLNSLDMDSDKEAGEFIGVTGGAIPVSYTHLTLPTNREV